MNIFEERTHQEYEDSIRSKLDGVNSKVREVWLEIKNSEVGLDRRELLKTIDSCVAMGLDAIIFKDNLEEYVFKYYGVLGKDALDQEDLELYKQLTDTVNEKFRKKFFIGEDGEKIPIFCNPIRFITSDVVVGTCCAVSDYIEGENLRDSQRLGKPKFVTGQLIRLSEEISEELGILKNISIPSYNCMLVEDDGKPRIVITDVGADISGLLWMVRESEVALFG